MNTEEFKKQRHIQQWQAETSSMLISEVYKNLKVVSVRVQITFNSAVLRTPCVKEFERKLTPSDRLYLHYECVNKDCTGDGFDLTGALREALSSRVCVEGEAYCTGKEDWKYLNSSGCSCLTSIKYIIMPEFHSTEIETKINNSWE